MGTYRWLPILQFGYLRVPSGALKERAIALVAVMAAHPGVPGQAVKAAQVDVKKAFQGKKAAAMPTAKKAEFDAGAAAERLAAAVEKNAKVVGEAAEALAELVSEQRRAADALEGVQKWLAFFWGLYCKVNAAALEAPSRGGSTSLLENGEDKEVPEE
ncbi:hypothetical protein DL770_000920 [Monosporascus sp. CRB-9-2]|nr:hypothetical protein DL770_000920 [Monosporascus sp. CRB-9-2]